MRGKEQSHNNPAESMFSVWSNIYGWAVLEVLP
nr:MAG TPA: hypothetical protein [Caudoviricetes sp.]